MLPLITGTVVPGSTGYGSQLRLRHRLHPFIFLVAVGWLGTATYQLLAIGFLGLSTGYNNPDILISAALLVFSLLFFTLPFWLEVRRTRALLTHLLVLQKANPA